MGESGKNENFIFLKYAILYDPDHSVKTSALKRIHLLKDHPDTIPMLTELKNNGKGEKLEPYFSMALSRCEIIILKEFEDKVNNSK